MVAPSQDGDHSDGKVEPLYPLDRDWMKKLILEHSDNPNNGKALVVAPMVDQSDYAYRLLCRKYGANVTFTPMMNAGLLVNQISYQEKFIPSIQCQIDRPLIGQLCGHDPDTLEKAAKMIAPYVDAIDLNCGCPQGIAKRGFYGAYLLEDERTLLACVKRLTTTINKPITVKVRILPHQDPEVSMALYRKLVYECGIHLLTVHGRTRLQLKQHTGAADWSIIQRVVQEFSHRIPVFANGNIGSLEDVEECFAQTGADGVMSSEAVLEYPALFAKDLPRVGRCQLSREYLELAKEYPPECGHQVSGIKCLKAHIHKMMHHDLEPSPTDLRRRVADATEWQELWDLVQDIEASHQTGEHKEEEEEMSWYMRHRLVVTDAKGNPMSYIELKRLNDMGISAKCYGMDEPDDDDPDRLVATMMFDGDGKDGDY